MHEDRPLLALALGAITESFAFFLPPVGWFVFLPVVDFDVDRCWAVGDFEAAR